MVIHRRGIVIRVDADGHQAEAVAGDVLDCFADEFGGFVGRAVGDDEERALL